MATFMSRLKRFDVYREVPSDLTEPTAAGGALSVVALATMALLFLSELASFLTTETTNTMFVDPSTDGPDSRITINMDITMHALPCSIVSVDAQDIMGSHQLDVGGGLIKTRLDSNGNPKGSPGESFSSLGLTLESARQYKGEGCRVHGSLFVKKVPGNFHVSAHAHYELAELYFDSKHPMNCSHHIHHLSYGEQPVDTSDIRHVSAFNPLDGVSKVIEPESGAGGGHDHTISFEYYIKIVPTIYTELNGKSTRTFQFTANSNSLEGHFQVPAVYFRYDLSPITVQFTKRRQPFLHFLVQLCAIIGGVFSTIQFVSMFSNRSLHHVMKKARQ
ncbi:Endoplasmic reticulum vesicle transporter C-terminal domain-containing protein [Plasmodiophora brassicae]